MQHRWVQKRRPVVCSGAVNSSSASASSSGAGGVGTREQQQQQARFSRAVDGMAVASDPPSGPTAGSFDSDEERHRGYDWSPMGSMG